MGYKVKRFVTGPIETNTYVLSCDSGACIVVDPSSNCGGVLEYIKNENLYLEAICLTHGHFDHFLGIKEIVSVYPDIVVCAHREAKPLIQDPELNGSFMIGAHFAYTGPLMVLEEGSVQVRSFEFNLFHLPGHSPGGCAYVIENHCFSGDSLFAGSVGRTDFPGCDSSALFKNIKEKLFTLPDETIVHSGHGGRTTIGREKRSNPFFK